MKSTNLISGLLALLLSSSALFAADAADFANFHTDDEINNIEVFKSASPAVVYVTSSALQLNRFSRNIQEIPKGTGTGFVWDQSGLIVTNAHVVAGASRILITLNDQTSWEARVIGKAPSKDLALLEINAPADALQPLPLGDSSQLEVGRKVIAIGNPFGLDTTLTVGVVSALGREINSLNDRKIRDVIQTDASINPGNSGGPLLNSLGQLIGVNTQIVSPSGASAGIGFAIPVNTVKRVIPQLLRYGEERRPFLGMQSVDDRYAREWGVNGVVIADFLANSPARQAGMIGLQQDVRGRLILGDIIIKIDEYVITDSDDLLNALEQFEVGSVVNVTTRRDDQIKEYQVRLSAAP